MIFSNTLFSLSVWTNCLLSDTFRHRRSAKRLLLQRYLLLQILDLQEPKEEPKAF